MVRIQFHDLKAKRRALAWLAGRYSFKSWRTGEMVLPEEALYHLKSEGIDFELLEGTSGPSSVSEPYAD